MWEDLYKCLQSRGHAVRNIWIADVAHQGKSGIRNERNLGNDRTFNFFIRRPKVF